MQTSQNHTSSTPLFWFAKGILTWEYDTEQMLINANKQRHCNIHTWCPTHNCSEDVHPPYLLIGDLLSECSSAHVPVALGCVSWLTLHQAPHHSQQCHSAVLEPIVRSRLTTPQSSPLGLVCPNTMFSLPTLPLSTMQQSYNFRPSTHMWLSGFDHSPISLAWTYLAQGIMAGEAVCFLHISR